MLKKHQPSAVDWKLRQAVHDQPYLEGFACGSHLHPRLALECHHNGDAILGACRASLKKDGVGILAGEER